MDKEQIQANIDRLEKEWQDLRLQAENGLSYLRGKIDAYKEMLEQGEDEAE